jgi:hypothetical protein
MESTGAVANPASGWPDGFSASEYALPTPTRAHIADMANLAPGVVVDDGSPGTCQARNGVPGWL